MLGRPATFACVFACGLSACVGPPGSVLGEDGEAPVPAGGDIGTTLHQPPAPMVGFSWVLDDEAAGMPRPGMRRPLEDDLGYLESQGITLLVTLTESNLDQEALARHGITGLHIPVKDFHAPTQAQIELYVWAVNAWNNQGWAVGTHCYAGKGRTGTMLAALLVSRGMTADEAIAEIRRLRPGSIETPSQEQAVRDYAATLN